MTKFSAHTELLRRGATGLIAGRLLQGALIIGSVPAAALIGVAFGTPQSRSIGEAVAPKASFDSPRRGAVPAVEAMKIVQAGALGTDVAWSPLTGDGSN
jgi:hypothetical protein